MKKYIAISSFIHLLLAAPLILPEFISGASNFSPDLFRGAAALKNPSASKRIRLKHSIPSLDIVLAPSGGVEYAVKKTGAEDREQNSSEAENSAIAGAVYEQAHFLMRNHPPEYPYMCRRLRQEGRVRLRIEVLPGGSTGSVIIAAPSPYSALDAAAKEAAEAWIFAGESAEKLRSPVFIEIDFDFIIKTMPSADAL